MNACTYSRGNIQRAMGGCGRRMVGGGGNVSFVDREQSMLIKKNAMSANHVNKTNSEPRNLWL